MGSIIGRSRKPYRNANEREGALPHFFSGVSVKPEMPSPDDNAAWDTEAALLHLMFPDRFLIYSGNALPDPNGTDPTFGINGCRGLYELGWIDEHLRHFKEKYTDHGMALLRACRRVAKNIPSIRKRVVLDHKKMSRPLDRSSL